jgi:hypothetical protein
VEKEATQSLPMTEKVMKALESKGELNDDLGFVVPQMCEELTASDVKVEKPSLEKLLVATKTLKSTYLSIYKPFTYKACMGSPWRYENKKASRFR